LLAISAHRVVVVYDHEPNYAEHADWLKARSQVFMIEHGILGVMDRETFDAYVAVFGIIDWKGKSLSHRQSR
jgi:hypothetical protein